MIADSAKTPIVEHAGELCAKMGATLRGCFLIWANLPSVEGGCP